MLWKGALMGLVRVDGDIGPDRGRTTTVKFMVDTGSLYSFVSPELVAELGLPLPGSTTVVMANGTRVYVPIGFAFLRIGDREGGTLVASMDVTEPLLGASMDVTEPLLGAISIRDSV